LVRVSIKRSARDPDLFVVRKLEAGMTLPTGRGEGYLVLDENDVDSSGRAVLRRS
jgi:hypothetical protein